MIEINHITYERIKSHSEGLRKETMPRRQIPQDDQLNPMEQGTVRNRQEEETFEDKEREGSIRRNPGGRQSGRGLEKSNWDCSSCQRGPLPVTTRKEAADKRNPTASCPPSHYSQLRTHNSAEQEEKGMRQTRRREEHENDCGGSQFIATTYTQR